MKNKKGFVLVETLVVTVFVMTVLTLLLVNYTPAISEFQRREYSDDVDSKYDLYWVRRMVQSNAFLSDSRWNSIHNRLYSDDETATAKTYYQIKKTDFVSSYQNIFEKLMENIGVAKSGTNYMLYLTKYSLASPKYEKINNHDVKKGNFFKDYLLSNSNYGRGMDADFVEYIAHMPDYSNMSMNYAEYRLIAKFKRKIDPNLADETNNIYYTYATIEVIRE